MYFLRLYKSFRPFSEQEAWTLFKCAAILEAIGWSSLLFGIVWRELIMPGNGALVSVGGRIHGIFFVLYIAAVLAFAPSLRWPFPKTLLGLACSVPPYASLAFELWASSSRKRQSARRLARVTVYQSLTRSPRF